MKAPVGLSSGRTFLREQDGGALPRQVPRVWLFCFFTKISCFLCSGYSCGSGLYGFYKMHCRRIRSLLRAKREPERTAVPAGHESPSGTFEPQTGLRSKCYYLLRPLPVKKQSRNDRSHSGAAIYKNIFPLILQRRRLRPAAEAGRSCWGRGQQDARPAQGP